MAIFNRKNADPRVLPEVEKYYDAEKRERIGLAWLLAFISIACVALLLIGAFFGGRWVYRKAAHTDKKPGIAATSVATSELSKTKTQSDASNPGTATKTPASTAPSTPTPKPAAPTPAPAAETPTPSRTPVTQAPSAPKPTATAPASLANTGPANTVVIFIISTIGFAGLYNFLLSRVAKGN